MSLRSDAYIVKYNEKNIGNYYINDDNSVFFSLDWGSPWDIEEELKELGLHKEYKGKKPPAIFPEIINDENRVPGRKRIIYRKGLLTLERQPKETGERFSVYRRSANKGAADYSPLPHDAPHYEGEKTPEEMREWCSWYAFNKMDDGTYQAELDEAWCWGGSHNDGGTIRREIPEEWLDLPYDDFLKEVVGIASAAHYGFTPELLKERAGLKEFFGYEE